MALFTSNIEKARDINMELETIVLELENLSKSNKQLFNTSKYIDYCKKQADNAITTLEKDQNYMLSINNSQVEILKFWDIIKLSLSGKLNIYNLNSAERKRFINYFTRGNGSSILKAWNQEKVHIHHLIEPNTPQKGISSTTKKLLTFSAVVAGVLLGVGIKTVVLAKRNIKQLQEKNNQRIL